MDQKEGVILLTTNLSPSSPEETRALIQADNGRVLAELSQNLKESGPYYIGKGKLEELKALIQSLDPDLVLVNDDLKGFQLRNLERELDIQVMDRTHLILDIFASRARTKQAKLQVLLAQLTYGKSRLIGSYSLSKAGGGIGTRGPGEQKLELDRRKIDRQIHQIQSRLDEIKSQRQEQLKQRKKSQVPLVSFVGYTNAGKSTMMNALLGQESDKQVFVKDMVFATLDTSLRSVKLLDKRPVILADTVGFISDLPEALMEAFQSTLDELKNSSALVHVLDGQSESLQKDYMETLKILKDLDLMDIPRLTVFNKIDRPDMRPQVIQPRPDKLLFYSALNDPVEKLEEALVDLLGDQWVQGEIFFSFQDQGLLNQALKDYPQAQVSYNEKGSLLRGEFLKEDMERWTGGKQ